METIAETIAGRKADGHRPWPRIVTNEQGWMLAVERVSTADWTMLGLWGDIGTVHMAFFVRANSKPAPTKPTDEIAVVTLECPSGRYPSVGARHPPAIRLERALRDLYGIEPVGLPDTRPWLDLGFWDLEHPLGDRRPRPAVRKPYEFLPTE